MFLLLALAAGQLPTPLESAAGEASATPLVSRVEFVEHFLLELPPPPRGARAADGGPVPLPAPALAEWRRTRTPDGLCLELEIHFLESPHSLYSVEQLSEGRTRLVHRELLTSSGRTLIAEWIRGANALRCTEWGSGGRVLEEIDTTDGAVFPLYLVELLRAGLSARGSHNVLDPLARCLERQWIRTTYAPDASGGFARTVELRREDASLVARYVFKGRSLERFQWQDGGWSARRISAEEFESQARERASARRTAAEAGSAVKDL
jgi:hypothetical protein